MMKKVLKSLSVVLVIIMIAIIFYVATVISGVSLNTDKLCTENNPSAFFDYNGNKIDFFIPEYVTYENISDNLKKAFIAIEDKRFFTHGGIDLIRTIGAAAENLKTLSFKEGGSTITQQLAKNTQLSNEKTINRKLKEAKLALELEKNYTKEEILEMYLNVIYFGSGCYGINEAAHYYFDKTPDNLTLKECAILAGIVKNPSKYSPSTNPENATERSIQVLSAMEENNFITQEEKTSAEKEEIIIKNTLNNNSYNYPYMNMALQESMSILNIGKTQLLNGGYKIETYYDDSYQKYLYEALSDKNNYSVNSYGNISDGMGILADNSTNGIKGFYSTFNINADEFKRQPGSSIKPVAVYAPALENNLINLLTPILDEKTEFDNGYSPDNYKGTYYGWVSPTFALAKSLNIPAVKIMEKLGTEKAFEFLNNLDISVSESDGLATALGGMTYGINIKQLCSAYQSFANNGYYKKLSCIDKIYDKEGKIIYDSSSKSNKRIMSEENAYLLTKMLQNAVKEGTAKKLSDLNCEIAAKTGTVSASDSKFNTDAWCVSYTKNITSVIWQGNADGSAEKLLSSSSGGGSYPASITKEILKKITRSDDKFYKPLGICNLKIDKKILDNYHEVMLAKENTPEEFIISEDFNSSNIPKQFSFLDYVFENNGFCASLQTDRILLTFNGEQGKKYKLYKISNNEKILIDEFFMSNHIYSLYDNDIKDEEKIIYRLESYRNILGIEFEDKPPVILEVNLKQDYNNQELNIERFYKYFN